MLTFDYRRDIPNGQANDQFLVLASSDGVNFTQIGQIGATGNGSFVDAAYQTFTFDLTPYISANTTIRFSVGDDVDNGDVVYVDNVNFTYTTAAAPAVNVTVTYTENGVPVPIGVLSQITDVDDSNMQSATITLINHQATDLLAVSGTLPTGITASSYNATTGVLTLTATGPVTKAAFQTALSQIVFSSSSDNPDTSDRTINVTVTDAHGNASNTATATVHVVALNDAPVIWVARLYDFFRGDTKQRQHSPEHIKFADVDTTGPVTVTISRTIPTWISMHERRWRNRRRGAGNNTTSLALTGTIAAINAFIADNNIVYAPESYSSADHVTVYHQRRCGWNR